MLTSLESLVTALKEQGNTNHDGEYIRKVFALGFKHGMDEAKERLTYTDVEIETDVDLYVGNLCISGSIKVSEDLVHDWVRDNATWVGSVDDALTIIADNRVDIDEVIDAALNPNYDKSKTL